MSEADCREGGNDVQSAPGRLKVQVQEEKVDPHGIENGEGLPGGTRLHNLEAHRPQLIADQAPEPDIAFDHKDARRCPAWKNRNGCSTHSPPDAYNKADNVVPSRGFSPGVR